MRSSLSPQASRVGRDGGVRRVGRELPTLLTVLSERRHDFSAQEWRHVGARAQGGAMTRTTKRPAPTAEQAARQVARRLAVLEKEVEALRKMVGDLKYEVEQMVEA
jgi:hypothetical protein